MALPLVILSALAGLVSLVLLYRRRFGAARLTAGLAVGSVLWGWAVAQYPNLLVASLTISKPRPLKRPSSPCSRALLVGAVLVVPSMVALFILSQRPRA